MSLPAETLRPDSGEIHITADRSLEPEAFVDVLRRSGLGVRRPIHDPERIAAMLAHGNLLVTAWDGEKLVGVARSLTDFAYVCYCSDLAVDAAYQGRGIGHALLRETMARLHPEARLYLRAAPGARTYYEHIGLPRLDDFFAILPGQKL